MLYFTFLVPSRCFYAWHHHPPRRRTAYTTPCDVNFRPAASQLDQKSKQMTLWPHCELISGHNSGYNKARGHGVPEKHKRALQFSALHFLFSFYTYFPIFFLYFPPVFPTYVTVYLLYYHIVPAHHLFIVGIWVRSCLAVEAIYFAISPPTLARTSSWCWGLVVLRDEAKTSPLVSTFVHVTCNLYLL
jgi:hypothetical protein